MRILAIESAALVASAAIAEEGSLLAEISLNTKLTHSQTLLPIITELFERTGVQPEELDALAISAGPGSFTGLRIGAATAKALGSAWNKPLVPVSTLEAMAYGLWGCGFRICPIMDARRSQVYTALFETDSQGAWQALEEPAAMSLEERIESLKKQEKPVVFLGDGVPVFQEIIREKMQAQALFAPPHLSRQRAGSVAALGLARLAKGETVSPGAFAPCYLRMSQAERVRLGM